MYDLDLQRYPVFSLIYYGQGGGETAHVWNGAENTNLPDGWLEIGLLGVQKASFGVLQLALIVIPLMIIVQFLKDRHYLQKFSEKMAPFTKVIGVQPNASMTLVAGLTIGLRLGRAL